VTNHGEDDTRVSDAATPRVSDAVPARVSDAVPARVSDAERLRRWRLVLGGHDDGTDTLLTGSDMRIDAALGAVYDAPALDGVRRPGRRAGGLGRSTPAITTWLGEIRREFPLDVVHVLQRDAIDRLQIRQLLLEPEMLAAVEPDIHLAALVVELSRHLPEESREVARQLVGTVIEQLSRRLESRTRSAVRGALARSQRTRRPRPGDVDWDRTIRANLRTWTPESATIVPERLIGRVRRDRSLARDVIIAVDQSGSMAESVVHAALFAAVLASMPSLRTRLVAFDTSVIDLTDVATDPVEVLFGVQLGGGTDLTAAISFCASFVERPADTVVVLVTDLFDGGDPDRTVEHAARLTAAGVTVVVVLALADDGAPAHDHLMAARLAEVGVVSLACSPDHFPEVMAAALEGRPIETGMFAPGTSSVGSS
jgi:Mg-chelatase subunit ChlD